MSRPVFRRGESITFTARGNRRFKATITDGKISNGKVAVLLSGDPFPVRVKVVQIQRQGADVSPTKTTKAPEMRKLAKEARLLGIEGYEDMKANELRRAIAQATDEEAAPRKRKPKAKPKSSTKAKSKSKPAPKKASTRAKKAPAKKSVARKPAAKKAAARKATAKKAPAKSRAKPKAAVKKNTVPNPFREKSNLHLMTEELMKGGKLQTVVNRLKKKMEIRPWSKDEVEDVDKAITKRVHLAAASLEKDHGFKIIKEGRGPSSKIQAIPPKRGGRKK